MDWLRVFPDADFRFAMALRPGDATEFFKPTEGFPQLTLFEERCRWIEHWDEVEHHVAADPDALKIVTEFVETFHVEGDILVPADSADQLSRAVGMALEPDWVLLRADATGDYRVCAGAVCFPSGWSVLEKLGKRADEIHAVAPGVNESLGRSIHVFLSKLMPKASWERENWGLSADTELNHHPRRNLKKLSADATLDTTWIRLEQQLFFKLPRTGAIVFGIRVSHHRLDEVAAAPGVSARIVRALATMPEDVAVYKGIDAARSVLIKQLEEKRR